MGWDRDLRRDRERRAVVVELCIRAESTSSRTIEHM